MKKVNLKSAIIIIIFLLNFLQAETIVSLSPKEKLFLKEHPTITLGTGDSWAPYIMKDKNGKNSGYDNDILTRINKATGANFIQLLGNWRKIQKLAKQNKIDGLSTLAVFEERKQWFNFSDTYISLQKMVFVKEKNPLNIKSDKDLDGRTIVINRGNMTDEKIAKTYINSTIVYADTVKEMLEKVISGEADATFGNGSTSHTISKLGLPYFEIAYPLDYSLDLSFAVRKDWPEAISILNKGLKTISQFERTSLVHKWFMHTKKTSNIQFTKNEMQYLKNKKEITMCIDPNWMPFEKYEKNKYIGMSSEYFKIFEQDIGIPIKPILTNSWAQSLEYAKNRKCDILSLAKETPNRKEYLNFTTPYIISSVVLATKRNISFLDNLKQLNSEKIGIVKGYAFKEILLQEYTNAKIIDVKNIQDGLQKVVNGDLFGLVDTLPTIAHMFQSKFVGELKISGKFIEKWNLAIGIRNDDLILLNIFNKAIKNLPKETYQKILNKYVGLTYKKDFDYSLFWKIFAIFTLLLIYGFVKYFIISKYNKKIEKYFMLIDDNFLTSSSDINGNITQVSQALCKLTGYTKEELIGKKYNIFRHKDMPLKTFKELWKTILKGKEWRGNIKNLKKDGSYYWADLKITPIFRKDGTINGFNALMFDITNRIKLKELSNTDKLTQIPNRLYLDTHYINQMTRAKRYDTVFSIIMIDIDFFKKVNDSYGHKVGDNILVQLAQILKQNIRSLDVLGRWGGEEFLIISTETNIEKAKILAEKIRVKIENFDFPTVGHLTCSFGVSQYNNKDKNENTFQRADKALYKAKNSGRNKVCSIS